MHPGDHNPYNIHEFVVPQGDKSRVVNILFILLVNEDFTPRQSVRLCTGDAVAWTRQSVLRMLSRKSGDQGPYCVVSCRVRHPCADRVSPGVGSTPQVGPKRLFWNNGLGLELGYHRTISN